MTPVEPASPALAFHYAPDGYDLTRDALFGRTVAGEGFVRNWHAHSGCRGAWCLSEDPGALEAFRGHVPATLRPAARRVHPADAAALGEPGALFVGGPNLASHAWQRRGHGDAAWSLLGVTHTMAGARIYEEVGRLLTGPVHEWDAVVCTSEAVRRVLLRLCADYGDYLADRFGLAATPALRAQLPVIPLGVDLPDFDLARAGQLREKWRRELGIAASDVCILTVGRHSPHAKANPVPSWLALEAVARATTHRIVWVCAGWFASPAQQEAYERGARAHAPSVRCLLLDGRPPATRSEIWFAADIFLSLVDNVQESFGLAPLEASAHGLPVVVSDWDGFMETIDDGVVGHRVPTLLSGPGTAGGLAEAHRNGLTNYDRYVGAVSLMTAVDVGAASRAIQSLVERPASRARMGAAGRDRVARCYAWPRVIASYVEVLQELTKARRNAAGNGPRAHPLHCDPTDLFSSFASSAVTLDTRIHPAPDAFTRLDTMLGERLVRFAPELLPSPTALRELVEAAGTGETIGEIAESTGIDPAAAIRGASWLLKCDILRLRSPDAPGWT